MVTMLELIWGEGYMAPGGPGNVAKLLDGLETTDKRILDVGCGIGGPAFEMAHTFGAEVTGIDLEAPLIERATAAATRLGLQGQCQFQTVDIGPLPFADQSFDIVISSGAVTQTEDTPAIFSECHRILASGGFLSCYEWMRTEREYSVDMLYWLELEELSYTLQTLLQYGEQLRDAGFTDVKTLDASDWYRKEARREYELVKDDLYDRMVELLGKADADHFVEDWRALCIVCDSGEMRQGYFRGMRPD